MAIKNTTVNRGNPYLSTLLYPGVTVATATVTTGTTPVTGTAAAILSGLLIIDCQDAGTYTLPTAALVQAQLAGAQVGTAFEFTIRNSGDSTLTIGAGTGNTISGTATIATLNSKRFLARVTAIGDTPTITYYSLGTSVF